MTEYSQKALVKRVYDFVAPRFELVSAVPAPVEHFLLGGQEFIIGARAPHGLKDPVFALHTRRYADEPYKPLFKDLSWNEAIAWVRHNSPPDKPERPIPDTYGDW